MATLTKQQILSGRRAAPVALDVPELGGTVLVRMMNGVQRERFERVYGATDRTDIRATLLAFTVVDDEGTPLFDEKDVAAINTMVDAPVLMRLYDEALKLNRVTQDQIEELAGN
jgi:hypothetical protein